MVSRCVPIRFTLVSTIKIVMSRKTEQILRLSIQEICLRWKLIFVVLAIGATVILIQFYPSHVLVNVVLPDIKKTNKSYPFFAIWGGKTFFVDFVSDELYHIWKELEDVHGWKEVADVKAQNRDWLMHDNINSYYNRYFNQIPDLILFVGSYEKLKLHSDSPDWRLIRHRWLYLDDVHFFGYNDSMRKKHAIMAVDHIIAPSSYKIDLEYPMANSSDPRQWYSYHRTWFPHSASVSFLVKYNRNPIRKILLCGVVGGFYPYRESILEMYKKMSSDNPNNTLDYHEHPGYEPLNKATRSRARKGFARTINRYFAAVTDNSIKNYIVAKIFEIPAAGALLLLNSEAIPVLARLNWFENVHYVAYNKTNMRSVFSDVLSERSLDKYEKIRWTGHQAALEFHTSPRRALFLHNLAVNTYLYG